MATIRDIATRTGVSTSTVSRALNGSGYVAPATKQKIMAAVHDLDYVQCAGSGPKQRLGA
ncbi:LacI family DNA-binding transcriptional regulator [Secundilactobacillus collinoides]|uniref:LacI family DNA-binding transcriptional regulator n=1 Tax=Secundilactobacillus collinoides TaxID=33960 RepID=UPI000AC50CCF|nr:LacI family DNA-binding transcriptional regulator [Secundilactobacillus collinoides]